MPLLWMSAQASSSPGNSEEYWILKQTVYRASGSNRSVDLGGTFVYSPDDKGFLPYNRQLVLTAEAKGLIPKRHKDSINFAFDYLGIRGPLKTTLFQSETLGTHNFELHVDLSKVIQAERLVKKANQRPNRARPRSPACGRRSIGWTTSSSS